MEGCAQVHTVGGMAEGRLKLRAPDSQSSVLWADGAAQVPTPLPLTCPWPASEGGLMTKCDPAIKSIPNQLFSQPTRLPQRGVPNPHLWGWAAGPGLSLWTWAWGALGQSSLGQRNLRVKAFKEAKQVERPASHGPLEGLKVEGQNGHIFPSVYEKTRLYSCSWEEILESLKQRTTWSVLLERWVGDLLVRRLWK